MTEQNQKEQTVKKSETVKTSVHVAPSPHLMSSALTTQRMMIDVLIGLAPVIIAAALLFQWYAVFQMGICVLSCLGFEKLFTAMLRKKSSLHDCSAAVTGLILALSLPWNSPWYVGVIGSGVAISIGKVIFGGLGHNIFNPAMVGRAFVMISFPTALGATAYTQSNHSIEILTQATPLTALMEGKVAELAPLFFGNANGSLGETSSLACILGGLYLCIRRTASWEIPVGAIAAVFVLAGLDSFFYPGVGFTPLHHVLSGALLFGAFFIATDPVSSPLTSKGKWIFGAGVGFFVYVLRVFSSYPEGVMFAVLIMNALVPLINRITIPVPVGGRVPEKK